ARHEIESGVGLLPELEAVTLVVPGEHALGIHAEGHGREPIQRGLLCYPVVRRAHERFDGALGGGFEAGEPRHDLTTREYLDLDPATPCPLAAPRQELGGALEHVEGGRPGGGQAPLPLRLRDALAGARHGGRGGGAECATRPDDEAAPSNHAYSSLTV